jgi:hypothetical protein
MTPNPRQGYATSDPRTIITPDAFSVSQDLVGTPLASPARRLAAILVDLLIAGLFSLLGWYVLGVAVVFGAFRAAFFRKTDASAQVYTAFKVVLGCFGTLILIILLIVVGAIFFASDERFQDALGEIDVPVPSEGASGGIGTGPGVVDEDGAQLDLGDLLGGLAGVAVLAQASDSAEGHQALVPLLERMFSAGIEGDDARDILAEVGPSEEPWWEGALSGAIGEATLRSAQGAPTVPGAGTSQAVEEPADPVSLEEATARYGAWRRGEVDLGPAERAGLEVQILGALAPDTLEELQSALRRSQQDARDSRRALDRAQEALDEAENAGIFAWVQNLSDDLGLLFGWGTVYLTVFTAWWDGRTVGKRLFGIRVVRLDGKPMTGWLAFERVGGYAAGFATGLLGFAQVYWDPNRMTIHDKIAETVVIREGAPKVPGPWSIRSDLHEATEPGDAGG